MAGDEKAEDGMNVFANDASSSTSQKSRTTEANLEINNIVHDGRSAPINTNHEHADVEKDHHEFSSDKHDSIPAQDPNLVEWDGHNDPENPMNFSLKRKIWLSTVASFMTFGVSFSSSVFSADTKVTAEKFKVSEEVMVLGVSLYVLGFACGRLRAL